MSRTFRCAVILTGLLAVWAVVQAQTGTALVVQDDGNAGGPIYRVTITNGTPGSPSLMVSGTSTMPTFSPDGKRIAYWKQGSIHIMWNDGTHDRVVISGRSSSYGFQWVSWTSDNKLYWSEPGNNVYKVDTAGGSVSVAYTTNSGSLAGVTVSRDGARGAYQTYDWMPYIFAFGQAGSDMATGAGCQSTISPNGQYVTENTKNGSYNGTNYPNWHMHFYVHPFSLTNPTAVYKNFDNPSGEANCDNHRFSTSSNDYVCFWCGSNVSDGKAYIVKVSTGTMTKVANGYLTGDYWDGALPDPSTSTQVNNSGNSDRMIGDVSFRYNPSGQLSITGFDRMDHSSASLALYDLAGERVAAGPLQLSDQGYYVQTTHLSGTFIYSLSIGAERLQGRAAIK